MRQRSLGILGGALLIGGIALGLASGIAANSVANRSALTNGPGIHRPGPGELPRHRGPGAPGPFLGGPRQPMPNRPGPPPSS